MHFLELLLDYILIINIFIHLCVSRNIIVRSQARLYNSLYSLHGSFI